MKLIITAGGTSEKIDDVRAITNMSTGRLGQIIAEAFLEGYGVQIEKIYYLHGNRAMPPAGDKVVAIPIGGVSDLMEAMERILKEEKIDAVVHSMAVSDYTVRELTTLQDITQGKALDASKKISSDIEDLVILLKKTPKVISHIKAWSPETLLVGFKLLSKVSKEELLEVGTHLLKKNGCTFVMANDLSQIKEDRHVGYLIHEDGSVDEMGTKEEIGETISRRVVEKVHQMHSSRRGGIE